MRTSTPPTTTPTGIESILRRAEGFCHEHGHRLTDPRRHVLEIIARAGRPIGAYDVLERLGAYLDKPKPPTAYRAVDFWLEHHFIHRIESLNAYILCGENHPHSGSQFLICDDCGRVTEAHVCTLPESLRSKADQNGFTVRRWNLELHGRCDNCTTPA